MPPFKTVRVQRAPAQSAQANLSSEKPAKVNNKSHSIITNNKKKKEFTKEEEENGPKMPEGNLESENIKSVE